MPAHMKHARGKAVRQRVVLAPTPIPGTRTYTHRKEQPMRRALRPTNKFAVPFH